MEVQIVMCEIQGKVVNYAGRREGEGGRGEGVGGEKCKNVCVGVGMHVLEEEARRW